MTIKTPLHFWVIQVLDTFFHNQTEFVSLRLIFRHHRNDLKAGSKHEAPVIYQPSTDYTRILIPVRLGT